MTIVGVVGDVRAQDARTEAEPALYLANAQFAANSVYVWLRLGPGVTTVMPAVREVMEELDPALAIRDVTSIAAVIEDQHHTPRFYLTLLTAFSGVALALALIGLYGVVACAVSRRTHEIGIRVALGGHTDQVVRMVAKQGTRPVVAGVLLGLVLGTAAGRLLEGLLFGVRPNDPLTVSALLTAVAVIATLLRRGRRPVFRRWTR